MQTLNNYKMIEFGENFHPEFEGYMCEVENGIIISAIKSKEKGKGHFSKLVKELKDKYAWIKIPTPSNQMYEIALHLGFKLKKEWFPEPFNCEGELMLWEKNVN